MKVKIYVDWENQEIILEKDKTTTLKNYEDDVRSDMYVASDILENEGFSLAEVFYMEREVRTEMEKRIKEAEATKALEDFERDYEEITLDI